MEKEIKVSIIGGGSMGGALARGLILKNAIHPSFISVSNPHLEKLSDLQQAGVSITIVNENILEKADLLVIAVKPWKIEEVIKSILPGLDKRIEVALIVAGIPGDELIRMFEKDIPENLSIVMPNTAMSLGESMTFIVPLKGYPTLTIKIFNHLGKVKLIEERLLPAATSLASCGIAYALRYVRAASQGGVEMGFRAEEATQIIAQTLEGAVALLKKSNNHPEIEIDKVTTPGGLTIKGLNAMEKNGFSTAVIEGLKASMK